LTNGWVWWHVSVIIAAQGRMNWRIVVQASPGIKGDPISKITKGKRDCALVK
jgi:hypothetical protein